MKYAKSKNGEKSKKRKIDNLKNFRCSDNMKNLKDCAKSGLRYVFTQNSIGTPALFLAFSKILIKND